MAEDDRVDGIAIVGMAGRFPGAPDVDTLWRNLCDGVESVRPLSDVERQAAGPDASDPAFVDLVATMDGMEEFDAAFFGMSRREAELTDPQHRILLETVWTAIEHAGYHPSDAGRIGIFGGVSENLYFRYNLQAHPDLLSRAGFYPVLLASAREYAITRAAYKLGLTGPAVSVITACSTSGVATHLAAQSLLAGDCDLAVAGAAHLFLSGRNGYVYQEDGILSPDGHTRAFDADARGTLMASGVAFVALKRLSDASADGDTVYAVIRGSAVNNDGAAKVGFTAPSLEGQRAVVEDALAVADVDPATIGMLEAHGTGTSLGDPIEVAALTEAFRRDTDRLGYCAIGSVKSNVGHLEAAAGVTGIIKAALALHHEQIPPTINFRAPNPQIDFASSPFFVNTELRPWPRSDEPRRAGISSFGFGGTNAHVVLEEGPAPAARPGTVADGPRVLVLSAKTAESLDGRVAQLADHLELHGDLDLDDVAHTLAMGRARMPHRRAVVARDAMSAVEQLRHGDAQATADRVSSATGAEVAFLFTGQGAQYAAMGAGLYREEPVFAAAIDECAAILGPLDGSNLVDLIYGTDADPAATERLLQTGVGQPAILALQIALARLWSHWGIEPAAMVGHSVGELAAAHIGGVLTLEAALGFAVLRGRLMQDLPVGAMTAVLAEPSDVTPLLDDATSLAAINAPQQCVASGTPEAIEALERRLGEQDIPFRRLPTDRAFHSAMMDPVLEPLRAHLAGVSLDALQVPMVSTMTGSWVGPTDLADPAYWSQHARNTVRFAGAVEVLLVDRPGIVLLEVGPGDTLASLVRQQPGAATSAVISTLPHRAARSDDLIHARRTLGDAWTAGVDVDWTRLSGEGRRRVPLPTYPFARERYWLEGRSNDASSPSDVARPAARRLETNVGAMPVTAPRETEAAPLATRSTTDSTNGAGAGTADGATRRDRIAAMVAATLADVGGVDQGTLEASANFADLGFDSLTLTQVNAQLRKQFGVRITLGQLLGETPTLAALAERIDAELAPDALAAPQGPAATLTALALPVSGGPLAVEPSASGQLPGGGTAADRVEWLIMEQLRIMDEQLDLLRAGVAVPAAAIPPTPEP